MDLGYGNNFKYWGQKKANAWNNNQASNQYVDANGIANNPYSLPTNNNFNNPSAPQYYSNTNSPFNLPSNDSGTFNQNQATTADGAPTMQSASQLPTTSQLPTENMFGDVGTTGNNGMVVKKLSTYNPVIPQNMPSNFNGTQQQWDSLTHEEQQAQTLASMGQKSGWEQAGGIASGVGSVMGGIAGLYGAYQNAEYQKRQEGMQRRVLNSENANKSAFAKASGGTYVPA
jgi:hypothetical protein